MKKILSTLLPSSNSARREALVWITVLGFSSAIILTFQQWTTDRTYPLTPVIPGFALPDLVHLVLVTILLSSLLASLLRTRYRTLFIGVTLGALALLALADIIRFHPWSLHYSGILFACLVSLWLRKPNEDLLDAARVIVGGIYFWSGVQKLNPRFMMETFPWFTKPLWSVWPEVLLTVFLFLGILVPIIEAGFALGFFTKRFRTISILGSTAMILTVLASIGPFGHDWNSSVWPWNVAIFSMVIVLFWDSTFTFRQFLKRLKTNLVALTMVLVFWVMPLGNPFGLVDHYLSWSLYSGHVPEATLRGDPLILTSLSERANGDTLLFTEWTMDQMNNVPYPENRVFETAFSRVCMQFDGDESLELEIRTFSYRDTRVEHLVSKTCADI